MDPSHYSDKDLKRYLSQHEREELKCHEQNGGSCLHVEKRFKVHKNPLLKEEIQNFVRSFCDD
jgi:hypothetical protein